MQLQLYPPLPDQSTFLSRSKKIYGSFCTHTHTHPAPLAEWHIFCLFLSVVVLCVGRSKAE